jgi:hypothetical protein
VPQGPAVDLYTRECVICLDRPRHVRFQCGHSTLCQVCAGWVWARAPRAQLQPHNGPGVNACGLGGDLAVEAV